MKAFEYFSPTTIAETTSLLMNFGDKARLYSGGTDLLVQMREGHREVELLIDIKQIPELSAIAFNAQDGLTIGSATSCYAICHDQNIARYYPGLVDAVSLIGGVQIQYRASLGGNLCNASPAADSIPALIIHRATCLVIGQAGQRVVPVEQFCTSPGKTILQNGETLLAIHVPQPKPGFGAQYLRFIPRNEMDIAEVGAGASVILDSGKTRFDSAQISLGAVAPTPLLVEDAGAFLEGKDISSKNIGEAARIAQAASRPISDMRGTTEHRKHLCAVLVRRALEKAIERARANA